MSRVSGTSATGESRHTRKKTLDVIPNTRCILDFGRIICVSPQATAAAQMPKAHAFAMTQGYMRLLRTTVGAFGILIALLTFLPVFLQTTATAAAQMPKAHCRISSISVYTPIDVIRTSEVEITCSLAEKSYRIFQRKKTSGRSFPRDSGDADDPAFFRTP